MFFLKTFGLTLIASATGHVIRSDTAGAVTPAREWCGSHDFPEELKTVFSTDSLSARSTGQNNTLVVDTYFHVVAKGNTVADGYLTSETMAAQFAVLQRTYAPTGIRFNLRGVDHTISPLWADSLRDQDHLAMKKALRKGDYKTLNLYYRTRVYPSNSPTGLVLGICEFPRAGVTTGSDRFYEDGCMLLSSTVPGGNAIDADQGITTTHEVGHWFGLRHTFNEGENAGKCGGQGDFVDDTPSESRPSLECTPRDSCPGLPGVDSIHNYMDYSPDSCLTEFTPGQSARMFKIWDLTRGLV